MKGSTALLTILGISFLLIGVGLVLTLPSQTAFPDTYPAAQPPFALFGFAYSVGDYFIMYVPPESVAVQLVGYPLTSLNYFGGFLASNNPVNVSVFGLFDLLGTPLVESNNTLLATYFTNLYSNPLAFGGVILTVVNPSSSEPAIIIGQSRQYTLSLYSNPMVLLGYMLIPLGTFFALMGIAGEVTRPEPLDYIPSSAGETVSTGLRIWKRIFALTIIPFGFFYSVYELLNVLGPYIYSLSSTTLGASAIAIEYGLILLIGIYFTVVATGIAIKAASDIIEGNKLSLAQNLKHVLRRSGKMYLAELIFGIIVGLGLILFIIPGIYLEIIFSLVLPAIVIADKGPIESFGTSKMLTENDKLRTFGVILAAGLLVAIAEIPYVILEFYLLPQTNLGLGILTQGASITSQLLVFRLPQILGFAILGGIILSITGMISPVILTTWFYSLGGAYEKAPGIYIAKPGERVMVCPNCKKTIPQGSRFCPYCGKKQK